MYSPIPFDIDNAHNFLSQYTKYNSMCMKWFLHVYVYVRAYVRSCVRVCACVCVW